MAYANAQKPFCAIEKQLKPLWDQNGIYSETDFLDAVLCFRNLAIQDALASDNYIVKILAIMDRRVGKRTLAKIEESGEYRGYPRWVRQFYELRLAVEADI